MPESEFHTDLSVGEILKRCRVKYNISYEQAERDLRIKAEHLEALEYNSIERLPGRVYVFGFVRAYSEYLGLDGEKMVALLKKQAGRKVEKVRTKIKVSIEEEEEEQKTPNMYVVGGSFVALIIALIVVGTSTAPETPREIPPVPQELSAQMVAPQKPLEEEAAEEVPVDTTGVEPAVPEPVDAPHPIVLKAIQNTWLEIRDIERKVVFSRVLNQGEEYWVPADQSVLYMTLGNAGGLQVVVEGQALPLLGAVGQVKRNIPLSVNELKASLVKNPPVKSQ